MSAVPLNPEERAVVKRAAARAQLSAALEEYAGDTLIPSEARRLARELRRLLGNPGGLAAEAAEALDRLEELVPGGTWALDVPDEPPAVWGEDGAVLWSAGEPMLLVGPEGVGKSTLALRLALARIGLGDGDLLGFPVLPGDRPVLYVAADRPRQLRRNVHRMVSEKDRARMDELLLVHEGPPPFQVNAEPEALARWAVEAEAGTVILDSLGTMAVDLATDEAGGRVHRALALTVAAGVEVLAVHHQRKATGDNRQPRTLADVYGSRWITSGAGSVLLLWGEPGDPVVDFRHLKQPAEEVGPLRAALGEDGSVALHKDAGDLWTVLRSAPKGLTPQEAARLVYGTETPRPAEVEKMRRKLDRYARDGKAHKTPGVAGGSGGGTPTRYVATTSEQPPL